MRTKLIKNNFVGATTEELFMYFLLIEEYQNDLFIPCEGRMYMPDYSAHDWYAIAPMLMKDLNLNLKYREDDFTYDLNAHWEYLREMWKVGGPEEKWAYAKNVSRFGELQNKKPRSKK